MFFGQVCVTHLQGLELFHNLAHQVRRHRSKVVVVQVEVLQAARLTELGKKHFELRVVHAPHPLVWNLGHVHRLH